MSWDQQVFGYVDTPLLQTIDSSIYSPQRSIAIFSEQPPTPSATPNSKIASEALTTRTPTSASNSFEGRTRWTPTDRYNTSPYLFGSTQSLNVSTPAQRPISSASQKKHRTDTNSLDAELASHVHHLSSYPSLSLPPVEPSRQLSSSPIPSPGNSTTSSCTNHSTLTVGTKLPAHRTVYSASSMQTPPPTATSAAKRKAEQAKVATFVKVSASVASNMYTPNHSQLEDEGSSHGIAQVSSQDFQSLRFSPDVFEFPISGPVTAPAFPQQRLFWDPEPVVCGMDHESEGVHLDFFHPAQYSAPNAIDSKHAVVRPHAAEENVSAISMFHFGPQYQNSGFKDHDTSFTTNSKHLRHDNSHEPCALASPRSQDGANVLQTSLAVNPNVLTGFDRPSDQSIMISNELGELRKSRNPTSRQPYHHQHQEVKREKELELIRRARYQQTSETGQLALRVSSSAPQPDARPGLKRSATDSLIRPSLSHARTSKLVPSKDSSSATSRGNISPYADNLLHTRVSEKGRLCVIPENRGPQMRTAVTLTVDASGRAKTQMNSVVDTSDSESENELKMDLDGNWVDGDSDSSAASDLAYTIGRNSSFILPLENTQRPRLARKEAETAKTSRLGQPTSFPMRKVTGADGPNLNAIVSMPHMVYQRRSVARDQSSEPKMTRFTSSDLPRARSSSDSNLLDVNHESEAETVVDPDEISGGAQHALRKLVEDRSRRKG